MSAERDLTGGGGIEPEAATLVRVDCARRIAIWAGLDEEGGYQCERWTMMMMMDEADQLAWRARLVSLSVGIDASRFKVTCSRASSLVAACLPEPLSALRHYSQYYG